MDRLTACLTNVPRPARSHQERAGLAMAQAASAQHDHPLTARTAHLSL